MPQSIIDINTIIFHKYNQSTHFFFFFFSPYLNDIYVESTNPNNQECSLAIECVCNELQNKNNTLLYGYDVDGWVICLSLSATLP